MCFIFLTNYKWLLIIYNLCVLIDLNNHGFNGTVIVNTNDFSDLSGVCVWKVKMSRRPTNRYSEMPMRVTDSRMSLINATPQKYNTCFK